MTAVKYKPLDDFQTRAAEIAAGLPADSPRLALFWRVIERIDGARVAQLQTKYREELHDFDPGGVYKYADIPFWVAHKIAMAEDIGLTAASPKSILDIGTGAGHFGAVCQALGHAFVGTDVSVPLYNDLCDALAVDRRIVATRAQTPLADLGRRFDFITIIWQVFHVKAYLAGGAREYWTLDDWRFFFRDLIESHLEPPGDIVLRLNPNVTSAGEVFDADLLGWCAAVGARVDAGRGAIAFKGVTGWSDGAPRLTGAGH